MCPYEAVPKLQFLEQFPWIYWKNQVFGRVFQEPAAQACSKTVRG
jgi:hypothetical protein